MEIDDLETPTEQRSSTAQKKRSRDSGASTEKSSNKKAKKTGGKKVSSTPKKLIEELLTDNPDGGRGLEETSESATVFKRYKELKLEHGKDGSQALVKSEVRKAIPEAKCSDEALRKRMGRSEKVYKLFNSIGKEKIARIKSTPPGFILNLTKDEKDYVMAEVLKQNFVNIPRIFVKPGHGVQTLPLEK
ncbi:hypothetical protein RhiirC2_718159 [Rhizophagus irregularis]|uniref:Uncharacterized protein n=1 Tax=Rhizophagus irregularis TaxID=588596 RepID=A0A2N1MJM9_9GLOM|nr:hypothetical protein RhiirC2_718159 [Rhizophagus irregularis]